MNLKAMIAEENSREMRAAVTAAVMRDDVRRRATAAVDAALGVRDDRSGER